MLLEIAQNKGTDMLKEEERAKRIGQAIEALHQGDERLDIVELELMARAIFNTFNTNKGSFKDGI